jgi:2-(1,2-epoxy-1,2-dihydrophenyl)acetyl-CoA isomerase
MNAPVLLSRHGGTLLVTLNRPERRNAFDLEVRKAIAEAVFTARDTADVKAVVLTGSGGCFCAGGDLKSLSEEERPIHADRERIRRLHPWFRELVNLEKPVIAAVEGPAFGAGFNLALACDFILGAPSARFCAVFARIGLVPDLGGFFLLPRIIGLQRAKELVFSAREVGAEEALRIGILYAIQPAEKLLEEALALAARFEQASTEALGMAKNVLNRSFNLDQDTLAELESYAQALARHTEYHKDAVARFLAKKPLAFRWDKDA